jgi:MoxR-like ATPase
LRHDLNGLFFVIATQNPVEFRGTYPLPEAQMDRFMMQCALGYVSAGEEAAILADQMESHPVDTSRTGGHARGDSRTDGRRAPGALQR